MYTIEIKYKTGNSFHSENTSDKIGMSWKILTVAKEALIAIKERETFLYEMDSYPRTKAHKVKVIDVFKDKYWYNDKNYEHTMFLKDDNGSFNKISCFWNGCFERINSAEIVCDEDDGMMIEF